MSQSNMGVRVSQFYSAALRQAATQELGYFHFIMMSLVASGLQNHCKVGKENESIT